MIKKELIKIIANKNNLSERKTSKLINSFLDEIINQLKNNQRVELRRFGIFKIKERKSRIIINPKTGKKINCPAKKIISFQLSKSIKKIVNLQIKKKSLKKKVKQKFSFVKNKSKKGKK